MALMGVRARGSQQQAERPMLLLSAPTIIDHRHDGGIDVLGLARGSPARREGPGKTGEIGEGSRRK